MTTSTFAISGASQSLAVRGQKRHAPTIYFWGALADVDWPTDMAVEPFPASPNDPCAPSVLPLSGDGYLGTPGVELCTPDGSVPSGWIYKVLEHERDRLVIEAAASDMSILVRTDLGFVPGQDVVSFRTIVHNNEDVPLLVQRCAAMSLPLPFRVSQMQSGYGHWTREGHMAPMALAGGAWRRTARGGRTGFDGGPFLTLQEDGAGYGPALHISVADFSGHDLLVEVLPDGSSVAQVGSYLAAGEVVLARGQTYSTPTAYAALVEERTAPCTAFHHLARQLAPPTRTRRPVQLNSWEAVYFGVSEAEAMRLAADAAALGAERFVLDDGWFKGRDNDTKALGDWVPDPIKFPNGLKPLSDKVHELGLEFGLWVEPEMVSRDSDLYRAHPDWALGDSPAVRETLPEGRNQLVLDFTKGEVRYYILNVLENLITQNAVDAIKWDMNRDLYPVLSDGRPVIRAQADGVLSVMRALKERHPSLSLEACASGSARMEFEVLEVADRFWTSDATDAVERTRIQRQARTYFPPELLGAHVGPSPNHITGRALTMAFRCKVAFLGHFGIELDPAGLDSLDRRTLSDAIALYKEYRSVLIDGEVHHVAVPEGQANLVVSATGEKALLQTIRIEQSARPLIRPVQLSALKDGPWRVTELLSDTGQEKTDMGTFEAQALQSFGLDCLPDRPQSARLFVLERCS